MNPSSPPLRLHRTLACLLWLCLAAAALAQTAFNVWIGLEADDSEHLETTRVMAAARQLTEGPSGLYGPYSGANPWVLIQAPLYYRLTGLAAWPLAVLGHDPADACLLAGRTISVVSFLACLVLAYRLALADETPARSGAWAVLIIMASPVVSSFPVTMRPDMLGVFLQTLGLALALRSSQRGGILSLVGAYAAFGLAICVKQHYVGAMAVSSAVLACAWWRGRLRLGAIAAAHALTLTIVVGYFGLENSLTSGMMWRSVFVVPAELKDVTAGSWGQVALVFLTTAKRSVGLLALAAACGWAFTRRGVGRGIDPVLLAAIALELALMVVLCLGSSGAWYNYALPAVVLGAVLVARDLGRNLGAESRAWKLAPIGMAAILLLAANVRMVGNAAQTRRGFHASVRALLAEPHVARRPDDERYFPGPMQHYNLRLGRRELIHDEWLYRAFEAVSAAEPRQVWLRRALLDGSVRQVIMDDDANLLDGLRETLPQLGFCQVGRSGAFRVWDRRETSAWPSRMTSGGELQDRGNRSTTPRTRS